MKKMILVMMIGLAVMPMVFLVGCGSEKVLEICSELEQRIIEDYATKYGTTAEEIEYLLNTAYVAVYLGTFNETSVVIIHPTFAPPGLFHKIIGGVEIMQGIPPYVWHDGELITLNYAYDIGLITVADLRVIARRNISN